MENHRNMKYLQAAAENSTSGDVQQLSGHSNHDSVLKQHRAGPLRKIKFIHLINVPSSTNSAPLYLLLLHHMELWRNMFYL